MFEQLLATRARRKKGVAKKDLISS
jgi:hypothetical protein